MRNMKRMLGKQLEEILRGSMLLTEHMGMTEIVRRCLKDGSGFLRRTPTYLR